MKKEIEVDCLKASYDEDDAKELKEKFGMDMEEEMRKLIKEKILND